MNTNSNAYSGLSEKDKQHFLDTYSNHPLHDYIDWKAFYESENGNEMDFVKAIGKEKNENGDTVYILDIVIENDEDYELLFDTTENEFQKRPHLTEG